MGLASSFRQHSTALSIPPPCTHFLARRAERQAGWLGGGGRGAAIAPSDVDLLRLGGPHADEAVVLEAAQRGPGWVWHGEARRGGCGTSPSVSDWAYRSMWSRTLHENHRGTLTHF